MFLRLAGSRSRRGRLVAGGDDDVGLGRLLHHRHGRLVDRTVEGHDAAEGRLLVALERQPVGGGQVAGHRRAARVGVLDDGHRRPGSPRSWTSSQAASASNRLRYDSAMPPCCTTPSHQLARPDAAVAGALLVGVLAVAQVLGPRSRARSMVGRAGRPRLGRRRRRRTSRRWRRRRRRWRRRRPGPGGGGCRGQRPARRAARPAPRGSRPGRRPRPRERGSWPRPAPSWAPRCRSSRPTAASGTGTGCTPPGRWLDALAPRGRPGARASTVGQDPAVDGGVQGLHPPAEHLGAAGDVCHLGARDAGLGQGPGRAAAGDQFPAEFAQAPGPAPPGRSCRRPTAAPSPVGSPHSRTVPAPFQPP